MPHPNLIALAFDHRIAGMPWSAARDISDLYAEGGIQRSMLLLLLPDSASSFLLMVVMAMMMGVSAEDCAERQEQSCYID